MGAALLIIPNVILGLFGIAETEEVWIRVVGMLVIIRGILYTGAVRAETREMYLASVVGRSFAAVALVGLALRADDRMGVPAPA